MYMDKEILEVQYDIGRKVEQMVGYPIQGLRDILSILTGPDVLPLLEKLITETKKLS